MSAVAPTVIQYLTAGDAVRAGGSLVVGATITNGNSYRARFAIEGPVKTIDARVKMTVSGGTPTVQIIPQRADVNPPSTTISDAAAGLMTPTGLVTTVEGLASCTYRGERVVDVVIDANGASAAGTITYVDVLTT